MHTPESAHRPHTVLIVDDSAENLTLMSGLLGDVYTVKVSNNGESALRLAQAHKPPDIILLDIMMPGMGGHEVCRRLKQDPQTANIPVIFLTAKTAVEDEALGFELGAVDYISKPISPPILLSRIKAQLQIKATADFLQGQALYLEQEVLRRTQEVAAIQELTILTLASLAESSSHETPNHLRRTRIFVKALAEKLRFNPRFVSFLSDYNINRLFWVAPLHDIGKV
ncbi:MAG: response regulator, partial [Candidatus Methylumidiphilus sp.]